MFNKDEDWRMSTFSFGNTFPSFSLHFVGDHRVASQKLTRDAFRKEPLNVLATVNPSKQDKEALKE